MGKRKKPKKKRPQDSLLLSPEEESLLDSLLVDLENIDLTRIKEQITTPRIAQALVERLPVDDRAEVGLIPALRDAFEQKTVQKTIRKILFKMKQKGISVPDSETRAGAPIFKKEMGKAEEPTAYLGPIDGSGNRGVFLAFPQMRSGVDLGMGLMNDDEGIVQFVFDRYSKKRMREVREIFFQGFSHMVDVSLPHAATVIERSYARNETGQEESFSGYLQLRPWMLENISLLEQAAIYDFIPLENVSGDMPTGTQIEKLLEHDLFESWIIEPEEMKTVLGEIVEAEESPILVSEEQKRDRINQIKEKGIENLYPESKRLLMKDRLEEMAYVFFKLDKEEYARLCLVSAQSLTENSSALIINPFLREIMERSLAFYAEAAKEIGQSEELEEDSPSSIILP